VTAGVAVLGSTGSIGESALRVIERQRNRFHVVALTALGSEQRLAEQARQVGASFRATVRAQGPRCLVEAATHPEADIVVNAVVGAAGLEATLAALRAGKRVALANKESLVMAGDLVLQAAAQGGGEIVPVDSEHSAVLQCITGHPESLARLILTASGGPFRDWPLDRLRQASVEQALLHPTWRMGRKITVDSATLANKALEVIEAHFLFGLPYDGIEVVVHPQSIVHGLVEFVDGSILAQIGYPSMETPILYALTHPERVADSGVRRFDPVEAGALTFEAVRRDAFPAFDLGVQAGRAGGTAPAVFNAANEVAVAAFLDGRITFGAIPDLIARTLDARAPQPADSLARVVEADQWARAHAAEACR
jgi:1-deoxy-D-xylulose-5-phosphate reductoisomerase